MLYQALRFMLVTFPISIRTWYNTSIDSTIPQFRIPNRQVSSIYIYINIYVSSDNLWKYVTRGQTNQSRACHIERNGPRVSSKRIYSRAVDLPTAQTTILSSPTRRAFNFSAAQRDNGKPTFSFVFFFFYFLKTIRVADEPSNRRVRRAPISSKGASRFVEKSVRLSVLIIDQNRVLLSRFVNFVNNDTRQDTRLPFCNYN